MADTGPFRVPPEVPRYFADKGLRPAFSWLDVWGEEHAYAFTVAKAVDLELLTTIRDSLKRAIDAGQGFETWRAGLRPELERIGWAGPRRVADPTGRDPDRVVDFTAPGRLQRIFSTNMRTARAAGQWERIQRTKAALPYLVYVRTTSAKPRRQHLAWAGTILPADDPWWSTRFPPNGWNCKCSVRQMSSFERDGLVGQDGYTDDPPPDIEKTFVNRRTGQVVKVPDGIDPGFAHNPGLARVQTLVTALQERLEEAGPAAARVRLGEFMTTPAPAVMLRLPQPVSMPVAVAERAGRTLETKSPLLVVDTAATRAPAGHVPPVDAGGLALAQRIVDTGEMVEGDGATSRISAELDGTPWELVVRRARAGFVRIVELRRAPADRPDPGVVVPLSP